MSFLDSPLLRAVGMALAHNLWQATAAACALAIALRVLPIAAARARYAAACAALAITALAFAFTLVRGIPERVPATAAVAFRQVWRPVGIRLELGAMPEAAPDSPASPESHWLTPAAAALWMACVALLSAWQLAGLRRVSSMSSRGVLAGDEALGDLDRLARRMGLRRSPALLLCAEVVVPSVIGVLRPAILFPAGLVGELSPQHLEAILAHELAHVRRLDYVANLLQLAIETLFFHHPAVRWMGSAARREREHCCDDLAAAAIGDAPAYAAALGTLEMLRAGMAAEASILVPASASSAVLPRIRRILRLEEKRTPAAPRRRNGAPAFIALLAVTGLVVAALLHGRASWAKTPAAATSGQAPASQPSAREASASTGPTATSHDVYYVSGVGHAGMYGMPAAGRRTLREAIAIARGPSADAKSVILRRTAEGELLPIALKDVLDDKYDFVNVRPDDVIMVSTAEPAPSRTGGRSANYDIFGIDLKQPGEYELGGKMDLLQAIVAAGGDPTLIGDQVVDLLRHRVLPDGQLRLCLPVDFLRRHSILVGPDDLVVVRKRGLLGTAIVVNIERRGELFGYEIPRAATLADLFAKAGIDPPEVSSLSIMRGSDADANRSKFVPRADIVSAGGSYALEDADIVEVRDIPRRPTSRK